MCLSGMSAIGLLRTRVDSNSSTPYKASNGFQSQQTQMKRAVCCRICNNAILYDWDTFEERNGTKPLAMAIVRRLAQDPKHLDKKQNPCLAVMSEDASKGEVLEHIRLCGGCSQCQGPDWKWTSETVAMLFREFCESLYSQPTCDAANNDREDNSHCVFLAYIHAALLCIGTQRQGPYYDRDVDASPLFCIVHMLL